MKTEETINTEKTENNNTDNNTTNTSNSNNDPMKRPDDPNKDKEQQPWKNPDPTTTPEREHIKEPYADENVRTNGEKNNETTENNNVDTNPTGENKTEKNPSYKPNYPGPDEKNGAGNDVEKESQQREYKNPTV